MVNMMNVLVTGGAGFIGSNFVRHALAAHPDWRVTTLDKLTYAGRLENLKGVIDHPRHEFVKGDIADPAVAGPLVTAADIVVHFAAETHVDRSLLNAGEFITTDVYGTFVLLEAAREAHQAAQVRPDLDRRGLRQRARGFEQGDRRAAAAESVLGEQGRCRSTGVQLLGDLPGPGGHHARIEQLRAEPVSREGHPALHHQRDGRSTGAALRRRPERPRLAARLRQLPRARPHHRGRNAGRGLQRRRRQPREERRPHAPDPATARQARVADPSRGRSSGARPPLLGRHGQAARARLDATHRASSRGSKTRCPGTSRTSGGGGRSRKATPPSRRTTRRSTGDRQG